MNIHIVHVGKTLEGRVIYNFKQLKDIILIKFNYPLFDQEKDVFLVYRNDAWTTDDNLKEKCPGLFEQIENKLKTVYLEAKRYLASSSIGYVI